MKKINQYKLLVAFCILPCWASCDYEEVNTNPYEVTDEEANRDGVAVGGSIMSLARQVFPVVPLQIKQISLTNIRHHLMFLQMSGADILARTTIGIAEVTI